MHNDSANKLVNECLQIIRYVLTQTPLFYYKCLKPLNFISINVLLGSPKCVRMNKYFKNMPAKASIAHESLKILGKCLYYLKLYRVFRKGCHTLPDWVLGVKIKRKSVITFFEKRFVYQIFTILFLSHIILYFYYNYWSDCFKGQHSFVSK